MAEPFDGMLGDSAAMRAVFVAIDRVAPCNLTVLVRGETGTGKELVARSLHRRSAQAAGPFVAVNCAALPLNLVESELFGFEKGSFTGAVAAHPGWIERANGGSLFLDEIAELPLTVQSKLLRVVQDRRVQRLGGARDRAIDVRLIAATHQDLPAMVEGGAFRRDLYHRINEIVLMLPPVRERGSDLKLLADAFVAARGAELGRPLRLSDTARAMMQAHDWPGNVRELENCIRRAAAVITGDVIGPADLRIDGAAAPRTLAVARDQATESAVRAALRRHAGDAARAARELDIALSELRQLAVQYRITLS
jgi:transcriptional regulator with PAS, ATPase and Fis domain